MDRRAALTKMAGTAAVGAGAVLVQSSPAFADFGSVFCRPTDCTTPISSALTRVGTSAFSDYAVLMSMSPSFGCAPGYTSSVQYKYRVTRVSGNGGVPRVTGCPAPTLSTNGAWSAFITLSTVCMLSGSSNTNLNNGIYTVDVIERRLCGNGARSCWCCLGQSRTFEMAGAAGLVVISTSTFTPSDTICNS